MVLYLPKYFGNFTNFISHAKSIYLKNIGRDRGNTTSQFPFFPVSRPPLASGLCFGESSLSGTFSVSF
jgi:hypothetical protein